MVTTSIAMGGGVKTTGNQWACVRNFESKVSISTTILFKSCMFEHGKHINRKIRNWRLCAIPRSRDTAIVFVHRFEHPTTSSAAVPQLETAQEYYKYDSPCNKEDTKKLRTPATPNTPHAHQHPQRQ